MKQTTKRTLISHFFINGIVSLNMDLYKSKTGVIYLEDRVYLNKVHNQIVRDFDMAAVSIDEIKKEPNSYQELFEWLKPRITSLINEGSNQFKNLLYRIDVSEKKIHQRMLHRKETQLDELVSKMIIDRCLQKVLTREKYS